MGYNVDVIEGVGPSFAERLAEVGISTTDDLFGRCQETRGRRELTRSVPGPLVVSKWIDQAKTLDPVIRY